MDFLILVNGPYAIGLHFPAFSGIDGIVFFRRISDTNGIVELNLTLEILSRVIHIGFMDIEYKTMFVLASCTSNRRIYFAHFVVSLIRIQLIGCGIIPAIVVGVTTSAILVVVLLRLTDMDSIFLVTSDVHDDDIALYWALTSRTIGAVIPNGVDVRAYISSTKFLIGFSNHHRISEVIRYERAV